ncbi:MAG: type II toxin-antitoxin system VapC family toxin [Oscillospiraceae bacterium]|nr:type II toxin-antitoxin system VapC family toxin [Oscillospiraceae bacterium]
MKCLLDTQIILWLFENNVKLSEKAKINVFNPANQCFVSVISLWEVALKMNIGKYKFPGGFSALRQLVYDNYFEVLPIKDEHIEKLFTLPFHHRDPFDRLIIGAALAENMTLITSDEEIQKYEVEWVF